MSTNITLKRSSVQGKVPVVGDLALGEIAVNTFDGKVFIKKNVNGTESIVDVTAGTNLSLTSNSSTVSVNSDTGTDVTILAANSTTAGVLTATDQTITGIKTFSSNVVISSAITANGTVGTAGQVLTSSGTGTYWSIPPTNLSLTSNSSTVSLNSDTGTDVIILAANSTTAGVISADAQTIAGAKTFTGDLIIADKIVHSGDLDTSIRFPIADTMTVETSGVERMRIIANGNVGLGTTTPADKLTVSGSVTATSFNSTSGFIENSQTVASNYTVVATRNAMSTGPITINNGVVVTIPSGSRWVVI